jgi:hypothetical protein
MNRDRAIAIGLLAVIVFRLIPGDDMSAFACGAFVGLVAGAAIGVAFVYGEWERKPKC